MAQRYLVPLNICSQIMTKPCNRSGFMGRGMGSSMTNLDKVGVEHVIDTPNECAPAQ